MGDDEHVRDAITRAAVLLVAPLLVAGCTGSAADGADPEQGAAARPTASASSPATSGTPSATAVPTAEPVPSERDRQSACVASLPLDVRIGQTMLVTTTDLARIRPWLADGRIAGVLSTGQLTADTAGALVAATSALRYGALLAADEEGGQVQRYREVAGDMPSARWLVATTTPEEARDLWRDHATMLGLWGVDLVLAPVVDVGHGPGIGSRAHSDDPAVVSAYGTAVAAGIRDAGLLPVLKHFPGHGRATGDSHASLVSGPSIDELRAVDLVPYRDVFAELGSDGVGVLVGHTIVPGLSDQPASQSSATIDGLLRDELGFGGLVVSDALGMAASGHSDQGAALVGFLAAGGDLGIIGPGGSVQGRRAVRAALDDGQLSEERLHEAAAAVLAAKGVDPCDVVGGPAPSVDDSTSAPSDGPVINPTEVP